MADDLHKLVTYSSQQERPFILVGSEIGALIARFYTQLYERLALKKILGTVGSFIGYSIHCLHLFCGTKGSKMQVIRIIPSPQHCTDDMRLSNDQHMIM